ncbi:MAG TPA: hypothetical protein VK961_08190 [Chthoniobacter sp.]|nr:hypothetical protein [Chthoniobacter sp.]
MNKFLSVCGCLALFAILGLLAWFLTYHATHAHGLAAEALLPALASARSVTISEHVPYEDFGAESVVDKELVPLSVSLTPSQITELTRAIAGHLDYGRSTVPLCYQPPFHRIEIVSADGTTRHLDVSFFCGIFTYENRRHPLPVLLSSRLANCFTHFGVPPRSDEAYVTLQQEAMHH